MCETTPQHAIASEGWVGSVPKFEYLSPSTLEEACELLRENAGEANVMAGGVAFSLLLRTGLIQPERVVDVSGVQELTGIARENGALRIGATAKHREVKESPLVAEHCSLLAEMEHDVAWVQVRNLGTLGGNICHAEPAADPPTVLTALGARVRLASTGGSRELAIEDFILGYYETELAPDEVLTAVLVPPQPPASGGAYVRFCARSVGDMPLLGVAAVLRVSQGICEDARIVLGNVDSRPRRAEIAEEILRGERLSESLLDEAAQRTAHDLTPLSDLRGSADYRLQMVQVVAREALQRAMARAAGEPFSGSCML